MELSASTWIADLLLRGAVAGVLLFHLVNLALPGPRPAVRAALAMFTLSLLAYLFCQRAELLLALPRPLGFAALALCVSSTAWLWLAARGLFDDGFRLSLPLLATFTLFSVVGFWNDFFNALIFLRTQAKQPVQLFLRRILVLMDFRDVQNTTILKVVDNLSSRTVKGAAVIITIVPILCVYPFLQKYFAKGIMVGAIKA